MPVEMGRAEFDSNSASGRLKAAIRGLMEFDPQHQIDFLRPVDEPALVSPESVSWQVFKNPIALFVGGIAAVLLELAEPRVRTGVWEHTSFRTDPVRRMRRTGLAAMLTIYGPRSKAEAMIANVGRMHARVSGTTPAGDAYRASDPDLLDWVQTTASFGFLEAYCTFVHCLDDRAKDRFYAEAIPAAHLYGASGAPASLAEQRAKFAGVRPNLERSEIVVEFLEIVSRAPILPAPFRFFQRALVRAGVAVVPPWLNDILDLGSRWRLRPWERKLICLAGALFDRVAIASSPAVQACRRMGLPPNFLYASR